MGKLQVGNWGWGVFREAREGGGLLQQLAKKQRKNL